MPAVRSRRLTATVAAFFLASMAPATAGINPAGLAKVDVDLPFVSSNVDLLSTIPMPGAIGATFRDNVMYATGQGGVQTFDISTPALPVPMGKLPLPHFENEDVTIGGNTLLVASDNAVGFLNTIYVVDITNPRVPTLRSRLPVNYKAHTVTCLADCTYAYITGQNDIGLINTTTGVLTRLNAPDSHDIWVDSAGIAWLAGSSGTFGYDITNPAAPQLVARTDARGNQSPYNDFIHHNSWRPNLPGTNTPGDVLLITEEDYTRPQCRNAGLFQAWKINGPLSASSPAILTPLDTWSTDEGYLPDGEDRTSQNIECSAHWFEERDGFVGIGWYNNGVRFLDVRNPSDIKQVGYYVPTTTSVWGGAVYWAPNSNNGIAYSIDASRGIDVLQIDVTKPDVSLMPRSAGASKPAGAGAEPHPTFGWGCRIPVGALA